MSAQDSETSENLPISQAPRMITKEIPGTEKDLPSVFLGRSGPGKYQDSYSERLPDLGFQFSVDQASHGLTGISAAPIEGYSLDIPVMNNETHTPEWKGTDDPKVRMSVTTDRGNLHRIPVDSPLWDQKNMGNEGVRSGLIRITNKNTGDVKYYVLGGQFSGRPDSWRVRRGLMEVEPENELPPAKPQLPEANP